MNLIRKYKISKINNTSLSGREGEIIDFIESKLFNLDLYVYYKYPDNIFLMSTYDEWIIEVDTETSVAYIRYEEIWHILITKFNMKAIDIQDFILFLLYTKYNITANLLESYYEIDYSEMESYYKKNKKMNNYLQL